MARQLAVLLGRADDRLLLHTLATFERTTGTESVDIALMGDIWRRAHTVVRQLGMQQGATAHEMYQALRAHQSPKKLLAHTSYVGLVIDGEVVSLHPDDVMYDAKHATDFAHRSHGAMRAALLDEIERRYTAASVSSVRVAELLVWLRQRV